MASLECLPELLAVSGWGHGAPCHHGSAGFELTPAQADVAFVAPLWSQQPRPPWSAALPLRAPEGQSWAEGRSGLEGANASPRPDADPGAGVLGWAEGEGQVGELSVSSWSCVPDSSPLGTFAEPHFRRWPSFFPTFVCTGLFYIFWICSGGVL